MKSLIDIIDTKEYRTCPKCNVSKPMTEYNRDKLRANGYSCYCRDCKKITHKKDYAKSHERRKESQKERYHKDPLKFRDRNLKQKFGISLEDYNTMLYNQGEKCGICGIPASELDRVLDVDHCHETGKIRGLLCSHCNTGIGNLMDNTNILRKAITYLEKEIL